MPYGIMRIEKRRRAAVFGLQIEANRTLADHDKGRDFDRSDIDWSRTTDNINLVHTDNWNKEITRQIHEAGLKERKDSTVMIDGLYTASQEWFEQHTQEEVKAYFRDCLAFHIREYCGGDESRVINAVIHLDETTPHMQVASVPIIEDDKGMHLSAKIICGGRQDFRRHQNNFYEQVAKARGLDRGEIHDDADIKKHTTKREWQIATENNRYVEAKEKADAEAIRYDLVINKTKDVLESHREELKQQTERLLEDRREKMKQQTERLIQQKQHAEQQKLDALRERDKARADRDMTKIYGQLLELFEQDTLTIMESIKGLVPVATTEEKTTMTGKRKPATITLKKDDYDALCKRACISQEISVAAQKVPEMLEEMQRMARDANENRIDKQTAANSKEAAFWQSETKGLEFELKTAERRLAYARAETKRINEQYVNLKNENAELSAKLVEAQTKLHELRELEQAYPENMKQLRKALERRRMYKKHEQTYNRIDDDYER